MNNLINFKNIVKEENHQAFDWCAADSWEEPYHQKIIVNQCLIKKEDLNQKPNLGETLIKFNFTATSLEENPRFGDYKLHTKVDAIEMLNITEVQELEDYYQLTFETKAFHPYHKES